MADRSDRHRATRAVAAEGDRAAVVYEPGTGRIVAVNDAAATLYGRDPADLEGAPLAGLYPEGERAPLREMLDTVEGDGPYRRAGVIHRTGAGHELRVHLESRPLGGPSSRLRLLRVTPEGAQDPGPATDGRHEELGGAVGDFQVLADQIPHIVWMADDRGRTYYLNRRWRELTGQAEEEALVAGWADRLHPADVEESVRAWRDSVAQGTDFSIEHRILSVDGVYRWHLTQASALTDAGGRVLRWIGSSVDIHLQRAAQDEVLRRERYFRDMFENAHDAIVLFDRRTGRVVDVNPEAERLYGYDRETFVRLDLSDLFPTAQAAHELIAELMKPLRAPRQLNQIDAEGRALLVEVNAAAMQFEDRSVLLTFNRDLTERQTLQRQLQQAQKMEAVGRLAGGLAHDFNNLTTAIKGFATLLADQLGEDHRAREALDEINGAADRATELTRQLLAYTRQAVMRPRVLDLNQVVRSSHQLLRRLIGADIAFEVDLDPELAAVRADPGQIQQVLMNLVVNARDAMPTGGHLRIGTANVQLDEAFTAEHVPLEPGPYVRLTVSDTGIGMPEEVRAHAFEPFYTTKGVGEGTGLGLATVYGIVKQSGGYIWVESEPGAGARFDIYLVPVDEPVEEVHRDRLGRVAAPQATSPATRILLVEDEAGVRKLSRRVLERAGFQVLEAADGQEAVELLGGPAREIDLVLTDMVMPRMGGKELAHRLNLTHPGTPVLFMSGYTGETLAERGELKREDVVIEKPFEPARLVQAVREMLETDGT